MDKSLRCHRNTIELIVVFKGAGGFMKPFNCLHANRMRLLHHMFVILCILELSVYGDYCLRVKQHGQEKEESKE